MNTTETLETMVKKQKEVIENWTNNSKTIFEDSIHSMTTPFKAGAELLKENAQAYNGVINKMISKDMTENMQNVPNFFQNWLTIQQEYTQKWQDLIQSYSGNAMEKFQANNKTFSDSFKATISAWENMMREAKNAFTGDFKNSFSEMTGSNAFLSHFFKAYEDMQMHWKKILEEGIMKGMVTKENFHSFFPSDSFNKIVDSLMGLNTIDNLKKSTETFDHFYETYFTQMESRQKEAQKAVKSMNEQIVSGTKNTVLEPIGKMYSDFMNQFEQSKTVIGDFDLKEDVKAISEKYFKGRKTFLDYVEKNINFQNKVYAKAKESMTETMENFWTLYQTEGKAPNYEAFMNSWLKITQVRVSEILNSEELKQLKEELTISKEKVTNMMNEMMHEFNAMFQPKAADKKDHAVNGDKTKTSAQEKGKTTPVASSKK